MYLRTLAVEADRSDFLALTTVLTRLASAVVDVHLAVLSCWDVEHCVSGLCTFCTGTDSGGGGGGGGVGEGETWRKSG